MVGPSAHGYPGFRNQAQDGREKPMSESTPSQAEGEPRTDAPDAEQPPRTTPSQAEGEDPGDEDTNEVTSGGTDEGAEGDDT